MKSTVLEWLFFSSAFEVWLYQVFQGPGDHPAYLDPKENPGIQDPWAVGHLGRMDFQDFLELKETKENQD